MRPPDSPDGTRGSEEPPGRSDRPGGVEPPAVPVSDGEAGVSGSAGKTAVARRGTRRVGLLVTTTGTAFAPAARAWRRVRPQAARTPPATAQVPGEAAGSALARLTALPAILVVAWLLPGLPLLLGGSFLPVPMLLISVPLAAALTVNALREGPVTWPRSGQVRTRAAWPAWFGLLATVAVVTGLIAWQIRESSQSLIVLRDAGTYLQAGYWAAQHGGLAIPQQAAAFGGVHSGLIFGTNGFLGRGSSLFPAVTPGMPMLLAAGFWIHGISGAQAVGPVLGGLAALSFAGLVARLVGPQWAPAGALLLGLSLPQQYISRSALSETALQVVLFGGLCLLADSMLARASFPAMSPGSPAPGSSASGAGDAARGPVSWRRRLASSADWVAWLAPDRLQAVVAGLAIGFGLLISLDGLIYLLPAIPFAALLLIGRRPQGVPFLIGFALGGAYGVAATFLLDRPFLDTVGGTAAIAGVAAAWALALAVVAGQLARLPSVRAAVPRILAKIPLRWLPEFCGLVTAAALTAFAIRPYVQTVRGHPSPAMASFIAGLQHLQGLPTDPARLYSEQTLYWVIWYIGLPTVLLGGVALAAVVCNSVRALLTWRDREMRWRIWGLPLGIICAGSAVVLWQPDIAPDQPWASQRLAVIVLPGLILGACWAASWLTVRARSRGARATTAAVVGLFCTAAMLVPTVATTFGLGLSHSGTRGGLRPVAQGLALQRTGVGETAAVMSLCAQIPRKAAVVIVSGSVASRFSQVIRGMCGVPVASMVGQPAAAVDTVISAIGSAGRRPVLLAASAGQLSSYGGTPARVLELTTTSDPHQLTQLPTAPVPIRFRIWMTLPAAPAVGA